MMKYLVVGKDEVFGDIIYRFFDDMRTGDEWAERHLYRVDYAGYVERQG